uniref:Uncharacterized protein n=1 Tax=Anguilla anguilla TaxID=7936 RepID=A0A0E9QM53_ANGAN
MTSSSLASRSSMAFRFSRGDMIVGYSTPLYRKIFSSSLIS